MTKVTPEQARKEFEEWLVIRNKEGNWKEFWEFCAELLEVNHQFYNRINSMEDHFDTWAKVIVSKIFKKD